MTTLLQEAEMELQAINSIVKEMASNKHTLFQQQEAAPSSIQHTERQVFFVEIHRNSILDPFFCNKPIIHQALFFGFLGHYVTLQDQIGSACCLSEKWVVFGYCKGP